MDHIGGQRLELMLLHAVVKQLNAQTHTLYE